MKLNFILPASGKTGGVIVVLEYARHLSAFGHDVRVYYPLLDYSLYLSGIPIWKRPFTRAKRLLQNLTGMFRSFSWFPSALSVRSVPFIHNAFIRDADAVIATASATAYSVSDMSPSKGARFYFIQHYEDWAGPVDRLDASYRLPLKLLTIAPWLTKLMREKFGREVTAELHNGIDLEIFQPAPGRREGPVSVLMMYHHLAIKGVPDGLSVLRRIHARYPEVRIRMFGMYPFPEKQAFIEYTQNPSPAQLVALYQESHVYLAPSLSEGWHLPPMEAMACGCAMVATRVGCIPVLEEDGNLLSAEPGDTDMLFSHMESLILNPELREAIARKGFETIRRYDWEQMSRGFERALLSVL